MNFTPCRTILAVLLLASMPAAYGQGTIVYHNPPDIPMFTAGQGVWLAGS